MLFATAVREPVNWSPYSASAAWAISPSSSPPKGDSRTVAIARGQDKQPLARKLGARQYIDSQAQDPAAELRNLGGANVILSTVTSGDAMAAAQGGLAREWNLHGHRRFSIAHRLPR